MAQADFCIPRRVQSHLWNVRVSIFDKWHVIAYVLVRQWSLACNCPIWILLFCCIICLIHWDVFTKVRHYPIDLNVRIRMCTNFTRNQNDQLDTAIPFKVLNNKCIVFRGIINTRYDHDFQWVYSSFLIVNGQISADNVASVDKYKKRWHFVYLSQYYPRIISFVSINVRTWVADSLVRKLHLLTGLYKREEVCGSTT